ncbi:MAG: hypothetical protein IAF38_19695 [Bacteroidia bacterium]|nr:hypothetical protein [Bacteroidia bacterium]
MKTILKQTIAICLLLVFSQKLFCQETDSIKKNKLFELSFGQSMLFISNSKVVDLHAKEALVVPTSSILFFIELRPQKKMRVPVFFNLPTETKQFLVNGQLVNERASPTFGAGLTFRLFKIKFDDKSKLDFEIGPLASFLMDTKKHVRFAPIVACRLRIMRGENFVMYIGSSYSVGINTWGLLYGTGTVF